MSKILEQHNISLPGGASKDDSGDKTEDHDERFHALKVGFSKSHAFLIQIQDPPIIWLHPKNNFLHYELLMVQVFTWDVALKYKLKERVQSN